MIFRRTSQFNVSCCFHRMEPFQKAMLYAFGFIPRHGVQRDGMDAAENAVFDVGVVALEAAEQELGLLPLGTAAAIVIICLG